FPTPSTATFSTLSLHDALPISRRSGMLMPTQACCRSPRRQVMAEEAEIHYEVRDRIARIVFNRPDKLNAITRSMQVELRRVVAEDRKSTRLNSSHVKISYAVFC